VNHGNPHHPNPEEENVLEHVKLKEAVKQCSNPKVEKVK